MKDLTRLLAIAVLTALLHFAIISLLIATGTGPHGHGVALLASGALNSFNETTARDWFATAARAVALDTYVLWPVVFLVASVLTAWLVPRRRWWHALLLASAFLPTSIPERASPLPVPLPAISMWPQWLEVVAHYLAYALLVTLLMFLTARSLFPWSKEHTVA